MKSKAVFLAGTALWVALLTGALVGTSPLDGAAPGSIDEDYFAPGGLQLLEVLRIYRRDWVWATKNTILLMALIQGVLLVVRCALFRVVLRESVSLPLAVRVNSLARGFPQFALNSFGLSLIRLLFVAGAGLLIQPSLRSTFAQQGLATPLAARLLLWSLPLLAVYVPLLCLSDGIRLAGFVRVNASLRVRLSARLRWATKTLRAHFWRLCAGRGLWLLWSVVHGGLTLVLISSDAAPILVFAVTGSLLMVEVAAETFWLAHCARSMAANRLDILTPKVHPS